MTRLNGALSKRILRKLAADTQTGLETGSQRLSNSRACPSAASEVLPPIMRAISSRRSSGEQRAHPADGAAPLDCFLHLEVLVRAGGDLGQVGHHHDLTARRQRPQLLGHRQRRAAADAGVHLVEHHGGGIRAQHRADRQHHARQLSPGGHVRQRGQILAGVGGELDGHVAEAVQGRVRQRGQLELQPGVRHTQLTDHSHQLGGQRRGTLLTGAVQRGPRAAQHLQQGLHIGVQGSSILLVRVRAASSSSTPA